MMERITFLISILSLVCLSCSKHEEHKPHVDRVITVDELPLDFKMPSSAWELLEKGQLPDDHGAHDSGHEAPAAVGEVVELRAVFGPVSVYFSEVNEDVLTQPVVRVDLPIGGGEIDLNQVLGKQRGSFKVHFEYKDMDKGEPRVVFVSNSKKRRIGNEVLGAGCNVFLDITPEFLAKTKLGGEGLKVNTTRNRHLSVLGGHFVLSSKIENQLYLTKVTFLDSENRHLFCEEP